VQEVIDALETQLDSKLNDAVRGVRVANGDCYVSLTKEDNAGALLETGLILRGTKIKLEDVSRDSVIVALSGVPHDVPDSSVARVVASYGTVIGESRLTKAC
jgi:type II secretory pathway component PulC